MGLWVTHREISLESKMWGTIVCLSMIACMCVFVGSMRRGAELVDDANASREAVRMTEVKAHHVKRAEEAATVHTVLSRLEDGYERLTAMQELICDELARIKQADRATTVRTTDGSARSRSRRGNRSPAVPSQSGGLQVDEAAVAYNRGWLDRGEHDRGEAAA